MWIIITILVLIFVLLFQRRETFWGGYFPVPAVGQHPVRYGRTAIDAQSVPPRMFIDPCANNIN